ncbi:hypothetical protein ACFMJ9_17545, partial [Acinetobacter baumannii]
MTAYNKLKIAIFTIMSSPSLNAISFSFTINCGE